jgi:hypothetical protein
MPVCEIYANTTNTKSIDAEATGLALAAEAEAATRAGYRRWYPTAYRESWTRCGCTHRMPQPQKDRSGFADYRFDRVPQSVLELIIRCRNELKLDWMEIRTPERVPQDPGLFCGKGEKIWLGARWSETGEHLLSLQEIKDGLEAREKYHHLVESFLVLAVPVAILCVLFAVGIIVVLDASVSGYNVHLLLRISLGFIPLAICIGRARSCSRKAEAIRERFAYAL